MKNIIEVIIHCVVKSIQHKKLHSFNTIVAYYNWNTLCCVFNSILRAFNAFFSNNTHFIPYWIWFKLLCAKLWCWIDTLSHNFDIEYIVNEERELKYCFIYENMLWVFFFVNSYSLILLPWDITYAVIRYAFIDMRY